MSVGLHAKCQEQLVNAIRKSLETAEVQHWMFPSRASLITLLDADKVLPQTGKQRVALEDFISESPTFDFVVETLSRELDEGQTYHADEALTKLNAIPGYEDLDALSARLVRDFNSLPWDYALTIRLPSEVGSLIAKTFGNRQLSQALELITPNDEFTRNFPLTSGNPARDSAIRGNSLASVLGLPRRGELLWDRTSTHLQLRVQGFIGRYESTAPLLQAIAMTKAFCGLGLALGFLKRRHTHKTATAKAKFYIHRRVGDRWIVERMHELDSAPSEAFHDLVLHDLDGQLNGDAMLAEWAQRRLAKMSTVFANESRGKKLILAGQWLFDSHCGSDELLAFVQTAVVMEILLGDKAMSDLMGLGELLRNRCAYLISNSHREREQLLRDFKAIYDVRSNIVHAGKTRLSWEERTLFYKLRSMCHRVIQKEVELLEKEVAAS